MVSSVNAIVGSINLQLFELVVASWLLVINWLIKSTAEPRKSMVCLWAKACEHLLQVVARVPVNLKITYLRDIENLWKYCLRCNAIDVSKYSLWICVCFIYNSLCLISIKIELVIYCPGLAVFCCSSHLLYLFLVSSIFPSFIVNSALNCIWLCLMHNYRKHNSIFALYFKYIVAISKNCISNFPSKW